VSGLGVVVGAANGGALSVSDDGRTSQKIRPPTTTISSETAPRNTIGLRSRCEPGHFDESTRALAHL
jgi:hypothetical protein